MSNCVTPPSVDGRVTDVKFLGASYQLYKLVQRVSSYVVFFSFTSGYLQPCGALLGKKKTLTLHRPHRLVKIASRLVLFGFFEVFQTFIVKTRTKINTRFSTLLKDEQNGQK